MKTLLHKIYSLFQNRQNFPDARSFKNSPGTHWHENDNTLIISVPVPGLSRQDLRVYLNERLLMISSKGLVKRTDVNYSFTLPHGLDTNRIQAKCRHGLLTIQIEKLKHERRIIDVTSPGEEVRNSVKLDAWWDRVKKKLDLRKYTQNVRIMKSLAG